MVANNAKSYIENLGFWGSDIHNLKTATWAFSLNYSIDASKAIGAATEAVDDTFGTTSPYPTGDPSYHFDRPWEGEDSRLVHKRKHFANAKGFCKKGGFEVFDKSGKIIRQFESVTNAVKELGLSLHPAQDWVAHGDYGKYVHGPLFYWHNIVSPQTDFGAPQYYPDDPTLGAESADGRPAGNVMYPKVSHWALFILGWSDFIEQPVYTFYRKGNKRYNLTKDITIDELNKLKDLLLSSLATYECRCYFLNKERK